MLFPCLLLHYVFLNLWHCLAAVFVLIGLVFSV